MTQRLIVRRRCALIWNDTRFPSTKSGCPISRWPWPILTIVGCVWLVTSSRVTGRRLPKHYSRRRASDVSGNSGVQGEWYGHLYLRGSTGLVATGEGGHPALLRGG